MWRCLVVTLLFGSCRGTMVDNNNQRIVIDNDAGGDDALATFLALLFQTKFNNCSVVALTTTHGNTNEDNVCLNDQKILDVARRQDVPIYRGAKNSIVITPETTDYFGVDGLGDSGMVFEDLKPPQKDNAVLKLIELSKTYENKLIVICIGPLTNMAMAIKMDPDIVSRLSHLYIGAGHLNDEKFPDPEFNAYMDVEAFHIISQYATPEKVSMLPFSQVITSLNISRKWRTDVLGKIDSDIIKAQNQFEQVSLRKSDRWHALDPAAVAVVLNPDLIQQQAYSNISINLCDKSRGIVIHSVVEKERANMRVIMSIKKKEYEQFLLNIFGSDTE